MDHTAPGSWWPPGPGLLSLEPTRVELVDEDDPHGLERAEDHAISTSMVVVFVVFALVCLVFRGTVRWVSPLAVFALVALWLRAVRSGIWLTRSELRAVNFPRQIRIGWGHVHASTQPAVTGRRVRISDDGGRTLTMSLNQVASGVVFNRSRPWRTATLEALAEQLTHFDAALG
jgi:hypothetical protein